MLHRDSFVNVNKNKFVGWTTMAMVFRQASIYGYIAGKHL